MDHLFAVNGGDESYEGVGGVQSESIDASRSGCLDTASCDVNSLLSVTAASKQAPTHAVKPCCKVAGVLMLGPHGVLLVIDRLPM